MGVANLITLLRIILVPILVFIFYLPFYGNHVLAAIIFGFAAMTDWLDGYLARSLKQTSRWGTFLDPVADKLIVATVLVLLVSDRQLPYLTIPAIVIVCREITVSALREWMAEIGKRARVAVSFVAKVKTAAQMLALVLLLLYKPGGFIGFAIFGYIFLYLSVFLTIWSMYLYLQATWGNWSL